MPDRISLPPTMTTCPFNPDGVLIPTTGVHAAAWKKALTELTQLLESPA